MSRNAKIFSDSKSLKEGMSPVDATPGQEVTLDESPGAGLRPLIILQKMQAAIVIYCYTLSFKDDDHHLQYAV